MSRRGSVKKLNLVSKTGDIVNNWTKERCLEWLRETGVSTFGSKEDLVTQIECFQQFPNLLQKLRKRAKRNYQFSRSLPPKDILSNISLWKSDSLPKVHETVFGVYCKANQ